MFLRRAVPSLNALLVLCFGAWWTFEKLAHIDINQSEIQQRLSAKFPIKRCVLLVCIELSSPVVTLSDGSDRIGFLLKSLPAVDNNNSQVKSLFQAKSGT
jgi:hypothetical protein